MISLGTTFFFVDMTTVFPYIVSGESKNMRKLLEGFKILCVDFDHFLKKGGITFKGEYHSREHTN